MSKVLTGDEAWEVLRSEKTKGKCGYYELKQTHGDLYWFVWDHREDKLRGIRLGSEEACRKWLL